MSSANGPKLAGIGRSGDSDIVLCMDARDAGSYPGEPTINELFDPRTSLHYGWGSSYMLNSFPIAPTVAYSSSPNSFTAPVPVPGKIEFGTYWPKTWWEGDINLGASRAFSAGDTIMFSGWYLPWTSEEAAIIAAGRGLSSNTMGLHIYSSAGGHGQALDLKPVAGGAQPVNGFNHWWYFEFLLTIPSGGVTGNVRIEDRGWDYYFNNSGSSGGAAVFDVKYYWCNVQIELKPYRTPLVRKTGRGVAAGEVSDAYSRPVSTNLMIHGNVGTGTTFKDSSPTKVALTNTNGVSHSSVGKFPGGSLKFVRSSSQYLDTASTDACNFGTGDWTIDFWFNMTSGQTDRMHALTAGTYTGCGGGSNIDFNFNDGNGFWLYWNGCGSPNILFGSDGDYGDGAWHHMAVTRRLGMVRVWVDGVHKGSNNYSSSTSMGSTDAIHVGSSGGGTFWDGYLDEIRITKGTALWSGSRAFTPPTRRNRSAPVVDLSGNHQGGNFATTDMTDVRTYNKGQVIEPIANAYWNFDGTDDSISLGGTTVAAADRPLNAYPFTFTAWVTSDTGWISPSGMDELLNMNIAGQRVSLGTVVYSGWPTGPTIMYGGSAHWSCASSAFGNPTGWTHIAYVVVGSNNSAHKIYINGIPQVLTNNGLSHGGTAGWTLGSNSVNAEHWVGNIANAQLYNRALSEAEVRQNVSEFASRFKLAPPRMVTSGLVVHLDSTNASSYPGTGTTWTDLSGLGNNGTLNNFTGPSAGSTSGFDTNTSWMMFDRHVGASDGAYNNYVNIPNSASLDECLITNGMTVAYWFRQDTYRCTAMTKWSGSWEIYYCSGLVFRTQGTGGSDFAAGGVATGGWEYIVCASDATSRSVYRNGVLQGTQTSTVSSQNTTSPVSVGAYAGGAYAMQGSLPLYTLYNRKLSAAEVTQNFEADRDRFGV